MRDQLKLCSGAVAVKKFKRAGWVINRQVGSHVMLVKTGYQDTLSVPQHINSYKKVVHGVRF